MSQEGHGVWNRFQVDFKKQNFRKLPKKRKIHKRFHPWKETRYTVRNIGVRFPFHTATCDSMLVQCCSCHLRTVGLCVQPGRERKSDTLSIQNICRLTLPFISTVCRAFQKFQFENYEKLRMSQLHSSFWFIYTFLKVSYSPAMCFTCGFCGNDLLILNLRIHA